MSVAPAAAARLVPPTNSAAGAYLPSLPAPGGNQTLGGAPRHLGAASPGVTHQLLVAGPQGLALAHLIAATPSIPSAAGASGPTRVPGRTAIRGFTPKLGSTSAGRPPAGATNASSGVGAENHGSTLTSSLGRLVGGGGSHGMGMLLPIVLVAISASAFLLAIRGGRTA